MDYKRGSGLLLHITSLPSPFGIGDLGPEAFQFVDQLAAGQQHYWQILPLNPTDPAYDNSPYLSSSAFAINPWLISPQLLLQDGLVGSDDVGAHPEFPADRVDFPAVISWKKSLYQKAFAARGKKPDPEFDRFDAENAHWLEEYALFTALKGRFEEEAWSEWPVAFRDRDPVTMAQARRELAEEIALAKFLQFKAYRQWLGLKTYANKKGIQIFGDLPIYVDFDSTDVWLHPGHFKLDESKRPYVVSGVPPDYFSATGQRWGNPIYNWEEMARDGYAWWIGRLRQNLKLFDLVRIDHFRGLVAYWEVPASEPTAIHGRWVEVPIYDFFDKLKQAVPEMNVVAEDLGIITDDVRHALKTLNLPGMKVLLFAFNDNLDGNPYLPHNYEEHCIVYTGTHDNNTARGWYRADASPHEKENLARYVNQDVNEGNLHWRLMELALRSRAAVAIIPVQDVLGLDERARMNRPGTDSGNWRWRLAPGLLTPDALAGLARLTQETGRA